MYSHTAQRVMKTEEIEKQWLELGTANEAADDLAAWRLAGVEWT